MLVSSRPPIVARPQQLSHPRELLVFLLVGGVAIVGVGVVVRRRRAEVGPRLALVVPPRAVVIGAMESHLLLLMLLLLLPSLPSS